MSRERRIRLLAPVVLLAAIGGVLAATQAQAISWWPWGKSSQAQSNAVVSTPPGITLQAVGRGQGWDLGKECRYPLPGPATAFGGECLEACLLG